MEPCCPIQSALGPIGKKWSINIIRDLFMGKKRFKDFLISNPTISTKMLSTRLKELEKDKIIEKKVVSTNPIIIEYVLTTKGRSLNKILYEIALFSINEGSPDMNKKVNKEKTIADLKQCLHIR